MAVGRSRPEKIVERPNAHVTNTRFSWNQREERVFWCLRELDAVIGDMYRDPLWVAKYGRTLSY